MAKYIDRDGDLSVDKGLKNAWKFSWLEEQQEIQDLSSSKQVYFRDFFKKINKRGLCECTWCDCYLKYEDGGKKDLRRHVSTKKHWTKTKLKLTNYRLGGNFGDQRSNDSTYGIHPMFRKAVRKEPMVKPRVPVKDRVVNQEATVLGFLAENSVHFTMAPKIINLSKRLASDREALQKLSMDRTSAGYKMTHGLAKTVEEELLETLRNTKFSLNIDEATSENLHKVLCVLVSFYCPTAKKVVVKHLASLKVVKADAESLYKALLELMKNKNLPWKNVMSILMDSCAVMRGSKSGLEKRIRDTVAPHLLDIDGGSCHHMHNASKKLTKPYDWHVETLFNNVFNDFKWTGEFRDYLKEICCMLGIKYTAPQRFISHRWLSALPCAIDTVRLFPALVVFYYGFLKPEDRVTYLSVLLQVYTKHDVSAEAKTRIKEIHMAHRAKKLTDDGLERKKKIIERVFYQQTYTLLVLNFYSSVLPILNNYVKTFEKEDPMIHLLYDNQKNLLQEFMNLCILPEAVSEASDSAKKLQSIDIDKQHLPKNEMFMGSNAKKIMESRVSKQVTDKFMNQVQEGYILTVKYLQQKLPIGNALLKSLSACDPEALDGHHLTQKLLLKLPHLVTNVLEEEELDMYDREIRKIITTEFPLYSSEERIDTWYTNNVFDAFPIVMKMMKAVFSCFHGPRVESAFSLMGGIIDKKSASMSVETLNSIQTIKYHLQGTNAVQFFKKDDILHDPINPRLCKNMTTASKVYRDGLKEKTKEEEQRKQQLKVKKVQLRTKKQEMQFAAAIAKKSRQRHVKRLQKSANRKLE